MSNRVELEKSWKAARIGKALPVPSEIPRMKIKTESTLNICRIQRIHTDSNLHMVIEFDDGEIRLVNFKKDVIPKNSAFDAFKDPKVFMLAKAHKSAVVWENVDIDIEAADLYDVSTPVETFSTKIASHYNEV